MASFNCPRCPATFALEGWWVYHLQNEHGLAPVLLDPSVANASQMINSDPIVSATSKSPADNTILATLFNAEPKMRFYVTYDLGRENGVQPIRTAIPRNESYGEFLQRLRNAFYDAHSEKSLRQWEYVLVNRKHEKGDPLPLTSSNTYYAMVSELLRPRSHWRHVIVRRSHYKNPSVRAVLKGTILNLSIREAAMPATSLPSKPPTTDASHLHTSIVDTLSSLNVSQPDESSADTLISDAPKDPAEPDQMTSTPPSRAWDSNSASARASSRTPSLNSPPIEAYTQELSTPSRPVARARDRRLLHLSSPLAPDNRTRDSLQSYLPLISSPLAPPTSQRGRRSLRLSSPGAPIIIPAPSQLHPPPASVARTQSLVLLDPTPSAPAVSIQSPRVDTMTSFPPFTNVQDPVVSLSSTASTTASMQPPEVENIPISIPSADGRDPAIMFSSTESPAASVQCPPIQSSSTSATTASAHHAATHPTSPSIQSSLPTLRAVSEQAPSANPLPTLGQSSSHPSEPIVDVGEQLGAPAVTALSPSSVLSDSTNSPALAPELFQRPLNLPPRITFESTSSKQAPATKPTPILRPRRPLYIMSRQDLNGRVEYRVYWNSGRSSWESHDSLYRDYPALINNFLEKG